MGIFDRIKNPYWDKVSGSAAFSIETDDGRIGVFSSMAIEESELMTFIGSNQREERQEFHLFDLDSPRQFFRSLKRRPWCDVVLFPLTIAEMGLRGLGGLIVDAYVACRDSAKDNWKQGKYGLAIVLGFLAVVAGLVNALLAQSLFFFAKVSLHVRAAVDGVMNTIAGLFTFNKARIKTGGKGFLRSALCLIVDGIVGLIAFGLKALCSVIPGAQPAIPYVSASLTGVQSIATGAIVSATASQMAITSGTVLASAGTSQIISQSIAPAKLAYTKDEVVDAAQNIQDEKLLNNSPSSTKRILDRMDNDDNALDYDESSLNARSLAPNNYFINSFNEDPEVKALVDRVKDLTDSYEDEDEQDCDSSDIESKDDNNSPTRKASVA